MVGLIIRVLGILLLLAGFWLALQVLSAAYDLYEDPEKIERFATAVEKGANIDKAMKGQTNKSQNHSADDPPTITSSDDDLRLSYFCAWIIVFLLLLLTARISLATIKTGGELALFDTQLKRFARTLIKEPNKNN